MRPHQLILAVAQRFSPMSEKDFGELRNEANAWHDEVMASNDAGRFGWKTYYRQIATEWYIRLAMIYLYIFLIRYIGGWMQESNSPVGYNPEGQPGVQQRRW